MTASFLSGTSQLSSRLFHYGPKHCSCGVCRSFPPLIHTPPLTSKGASLHWADLEKPFLKYRLFLFFLCAERQIFVLLGPSGISARSGQITGAHCLEHRSKAGFSFFPSPNGVFFSLGQLWERFYYQRKVSSVSSLILPHGAIHGPEPLGNHPGPLKAPWRFFQRPSNRWFLSASVEWDESMGDPGGLFRPWIIYTHWVILHFRPALFYACNF